jgi:transcription elongation factor Elf1
MSDLKRSLKCSSCGNESSIFVSGGLELREVLIAGKCPSCGTAMQVNYSVIEKEVRSERASIEESSSASMPNLDDSLFSSDVPSDTLKDIMED